jgi:hypothetical protein
MKGVVFYGVGSNNFLPSLTNSNSSPNYSQT